jgi:dienelactone hydrolase
VTLDDDRASDPGAVPLHALPDPFAWPDGRRVADAAGWRERARGWRALVADVGYGGLPPVPDAVTWETLGESRVHAFPGAPWLAGYRVAATVGSSTVRFVVRVLRPEVGTAVPTIVYGDGGWWNLTDAVARRVAARGIALVWFDRTELAADVVGDRAPGPEARGGLYAALPRGAFGAVAAWAWGFHRAVDLVHGLPELDAAKVAVTGFSRGGKAALVAGATDERITLVHDHASGAGGGATFRHVGAGGETLAALVARFPSWFGPRLPAFAGREEALPYDQHCLLATIAPRPLLLTYAADDRWSNPEGMVHAARAAGAVYHFLGCGDALAYHVRPGGHAHTEEDWARLLDFVAWRWQGGAVPDGLGRHPFGAFEPAFGWRAPRPVA